MKSFFFYVIGIQVQGIDELLMLRNANTLIIFNLIGLGRKFHPTFGNLLFTHFSREIFPFWIDTHKIFVIGIKQNPMDLIFS